MTVLDGRALDARAYTAAQLRALVAAIDIDDVIDLDAPLPGGVCLDFPAERFVAAFGLARRLWWHGFDPRLLSSFAAAARRGERLDDDARYAFKQVRARFKHLRFAFFLFAAEHRAPPLLSLMTLEMGELQDALRVGRPDLRRHAAALQTLLAPPLRWPMIREVNRLRPTDAAGYRRFTLAEVASLRPLLAQELIGAHAFHAARKVVSRQVSFHGDMEVLYGPVGHRPVARWLATLNGLMGAYHDELVSHNASGSQSYRHDRFPLPDEIRRRLEQLVSLYLGASSSVPPAA